MDNKQTEQETAHVFTWSANTMNVERNRMKAYEQISDSVTDRNDFNDYDGATEKYIEALCEEIKTRDLKIAELNETVRQFMGDLA